MTEKYNLINDLTELSNSYNKIMKSRITPTTEEEAKIEMDKLVSSGKLIIYFYNNIFRRKYMNTSGDGFDESHKLLKDLSLEAHYAIESKSYLELSSLQIEHGSKKSDPNMLEKLIMDLKK